MDALPQGFTLDQAPQGIDSSQAPPPGFELDEDKYGGVGGMAKAAALGFLRGATLGASDVLATKTGLVKPETIQGLSEQNPAPSMGFEALGAVGSAVLAPELSPVALIGKAGKAVAGGVAALDAMKVADTTSKIGKVLGAVSEIGSHTLGSAVEGSLYTGIGNTLNEYALGDPGLNGEKVAANFGYGAILGGALGGALKTAEIGVPEAVTAAKEGMVSLRDKLIGAGGKEGEAGLINKVLPNEIGEALQSRTAQLTPEERVSTINDITKDLSAVNNNTETALKQLNQTIRPAERDILINTAAPPERLAVVRQDIINTMNKALDQAAERPALYDPGPIAKLEMIRDDFVGQLKNNISPAEIHEHLIEAKQQLQTLAYTKTSSTAQDTKALINGVSGLIRDVTHDPEIFGMAGSSQAAHDALLAEHYQFTPPGNKATPFRKAFMEKDGRGNWQMSAQKVELALKQKGTIKGDDKINLLNSWWDHLQKIPDHLENTFQNVPNELWDENKLNNMSDILKNSKLSSSEAAEKYITSVKNQKMRGSGLKDIGATIVGAMHPAVGAAMEAYNIATKPLDYINKLAEVERMIGKTTASIGRGAKSIFEQGARLGDASKSVATRFEAKDQIDKKQQMQKEFSSFQADPAAFAEKLGASTERLHNTAPQIAQSLQMSTANAVQFLTSKLPSKPHTNVFTSPYEPSPMEMAKFDRYLNVVEKPTIALAQIKSGLIGPETIEALQSVYPKLLDQMRQAVFMEATNQAKRGNEIPYQLKQSISMFLGQPIDQSLTPQNVMNNQMVFQQPANPQGPGQGKAPASGIKDIDQSSRLGLSSQDNLDA